MLDCKQFSGAAKTALDFIHDQQGIMGITDAAGGLDICFIGRIYAALTLHDFHNEGGGLIRDGLLQGFDVVIGNMTKARDQRLEAFTIFFIVGG